MGAEQSTQAVQPLHVAEQQAEIQQEQLQDVSCTAMDLCQGLVLRTLFPTDSSWCRHRRRWPASHGHWLFVGPPALERGRW
jgi:hypothetical protein